VSEFFGDSVETQHFSKYTVVDVDVEVEGRKKKEEKKKERRRKKKDDQVFGYWQSSFGHHRTYNR